MLRKVLLSFEHNADLDVNSYINYIVVKLVVKMVRTELTNVSFLYHKKYINIYFQ